MSNGGIPEERPQFAYMRAALCAHTGDLDMVIQTYDALSQQLFAHPSNVILHAATETQIQPTDVVVHADPSLDDPSPTLAILDDVWSTGAEAGIYMGAVSSAKYVLPLNHSISA